MTRTWLADELFGDLNRFYKAAEQRLHHQFFYPQPMYRPFLSIEEQNQWMGLSSDPSIKPYVGEVFTESKYGHQVYDEFGGILLNQCGFLDVKEFMKAVRSYLELNHSIVFEHFDETLLDIHAEAVKYKQYQAKKIILCNGIGALNGLRYRDLPLRLLKGETLTIELEATPELIYNRGVYIVPMGEMNHYRVGATYETKNLSESVTEGGRKELEKKLQGLIKMSHKIISQDWGFRPTTPDRRPILGEHPDSKNVIIFNGLGTKGVSLAPYFSAQLTNWLLSKGEIQPEVNIKRFKSLSSKSSAEV